jgi:hypothetical protein
MVMPIRVSMAEMPLWTLSTTTESHNGTGETLYVCHSLDTFRPIRSYCELDESLFREALSITKPDDLQKFMQDHPRILPYFCDDPISEDDYLEMVIRYLQHFKEFNVLLASVTDYHTLAANTADSETLHEAALDIVQKFRMYPDHPAHRHAARVYGWSEEKMQTIENDSKLLASFVQEYTATLEYFYTQMCSDVRMHTSLTDGTIELRCRSLLDALFCYALIAQKNNCLIRKCKNKNCNNYFFVGSHDQLYCDYHMAPRRRKYKSQNERRRKN